MLTYLKDKEVLRRHFDQDRSLFAYHIGDLDDFHFGHCQWLSWVVDGDVKDVVLLYGGCKMPTVIAFGLTEHMPALLAELSPKLPDLFHSHFYEAYRDILLKGRTQQRLGSHLKMQLKQFVPCERKVDGELVAPLGHEHEAELQELYDAAYPGNYFVTRMLESGKYCGVKLDGRLVSVSGVHVDSTEYGTATLGNIATHPDYRGRGLGSVLTSHVCAQLVAEDKAVGLNVSATNAAAIHTYEKLGFEIVHRYEEAIFTRKDQGHS